MLLEGLQRARGHHRAKTAKLRRWFPFQLFRGPAGRINPARRAGIQKWNMSREIEPKRHQQQACGKSSLRAGRFYEGGDQEDNHTEERSA